MNNLTPHIIRALQGKSTPEISFLDYPPREWSWTIALSITHALLDVKTQKMFLSQNIELNNNIVYLNLAKTWFTKLQKYINMEPAIMPNALAILESMLLNSNGPMLRLYGKQSNLLISSLIKSLHKTGESKNKDWWENYYSMRQTIENDDEFKIKIQDSILMYPAGWSNDNEVKFNHAYSTILIPLLNGSETSKNINVFNASTMAYDLYNTKNRSFKDWIEHSDKVKNENCSSIKIIKEGSYDLYESSIKRSLPFTIEIYLALSNVGSSRPTHIDITINNTTQLSDHITVNMAHSLEFANYINKLLKDWFNSDVLLNHLNGDKLEPSVDVRCSIMNPKLNSFILDNIESSIRDELPHISKSESLSSFKQV